MKGFGRVAVVILTLAALVGGFAGGTAALDISQPANKSVTARVQFVVTKNDTASTVAQRLQDDGLIRSALIFRYWARYKHLDSGIEQGVYILSPSMSTNEIISALQRAPINTISIVIPDGYRAEQYPYFLTGDSGLPNFDARQFLQIARTGVLPNGVKLWTQYWFIPDPTTAPGVYNALEGYLYPAGYQFYLSATASDVVIKMLNQFGYELCPGPASSPYAYVGDAAQCRQYAVTINGTNIFDVMRATYPDAQSDVEALRDALIIASFAAREVRSTSDAPGVAAVYYNRYVSMSTQTTTPGGYFPTLGSDPSVEYARDNQTPPANGHWWTALTDSGKNIAPDDPYNTYTTKGMPPGPIANPYIAEINAGIAPPPSKYYWFVSNACFKILYGVTSQDFETIKGQMNSC